MNLAKLIMPKKFFIERSLMTKSLLLLFSLVGFCILSGVIEAAPLPHVKAFIFTIEKLSQIETSQGVQSHFQLKGEIAPGYYLYRKKFHMNLGKEGELKMDYPKPTQYLFHQGEKQDLYSGKMLIPFSVISNAGSPIVLNLEYQGCAEEGFCYPPLQKTFELLSGKSTSSSLFFISSLGELLTNQQAIVKSLHTVHWGLMLLLFGLLGLLLAFTPCILPMLPLLVGIIGGQQKPLSTGKAFGLSLAYVLGTALTYAFAGVIAAKVGYSLQAHLQRPSVILFTSGLFVILSFALFGFYELRFPLFIQRHLSRISINQKGGTYLSVFSMGVLAAFMVSPCITAPLAGVLIFISETGNLWFGGIALFILGLGMGIPLLLVGVSAGKFLPKTGKWMKGVQYLLGLLMMAMAVWLLLRIVPGDTPMVKDHLFTRVSNVSELEEKLKAAKHAHQEVLLDFYASWCTSCVTMDQQVLRSETVQKALKPYQMLRADLSLNTDEDAAIMKQFDVIAPPTILFFNKKGKEEKDKRIVGEVSEEQFLKRLPQ